MSSDSEHEEIDILNKVIKDTKQKLNNVKKNEIKKELDKKKSDNYEKIKNEKRLYEDIKQDFEKTHFKLMSPLSYIRYDNITNELFRMTKQDFSNSYENIYFDSVNKKGELCKEQFIKRWFKDEEIRTIKFIDFLPKQKEPEGIFNTFKQYEVEQLLRPHNPNYNYTSVPFDPHEIVKNSFIFKHLENLCGNDRDVINYVVMWLSRLIKKPYDITKTALIFKSTQGTGKDLFFDWFGRHILGNMYYHNEEKTELVFGRFNGIIQNKILVVLNEANGKDTFQVNENIKMAITRTHNTIERKGKEAFTNTNNIGYVFLTNNDNSLNISSEDRRFVAIKCNNIYANNAEYFKNIIDEMTSKSIDRYFYDYLNSIDSDKFDFTGMRPKTELYEDMKELNKSALIYFLEDLIFINKKIESCSFSPSDLFTKFKDFIHNNNFKYEISNIKFCFELKKFEKSITKERTSVSRKITINFKMLYNELVDKKLIKPYDIIEEQKDNDITI